MAVSLKSFGTLSSYGAAITKPTGSGFCYVTITVSWFYADGVPSVNGQTGWTLHDKISDLRGSDNTSTAILGKYVDLGSEPSSYTIDLTAGGDARGITAAWDGVDSSNPVADTSSVAHADGTVTVAVPAADVLRDGSASVLSCGDWGFQQWLMISPGLQVPPPGFSAQDTGNAEEHALFYATGLSIGTIGGNFGWATDRFAVVQAVLQPALLDTGNPVFFGANF